MRREGKISCRIRHYYQLNYDHHLETCQILHQEIITLRLSGTPQDRDMIGNSRIDTKAEVNKLPYIDILNTIREMVFSEKLIDIQTSEIESKLTKF